VIEPTVAASTHKRYGQLLRLPVYPHIGRLRLTKLEPSHLAQLYARRVKAGRSPTTVLQLHRVLDHALKDTHRRGLAPRNLASLVTPPLKEAHEFVTFSPEQARRFLKAVAGDRLEALYVVGLTTGIREGELLGLRWADVDLDEAALHVTRRLKRRTSAARSSSSPRPSRRSSSTASAKRTSAGARARPGTTKVSCSRTPSADRSTHPTSCAAASTRC
jgi:integrase